jgi:hypothetical protein
MVFLDFDISEFWHPRHLSASFLVLASPKIPMGVITKGQYEYMLPYFGILEIGILKGVFPCTRQSENPDGCNPEKV